MRQEVKVGHGGALDRMAEGILIIGFGDSTLELGLFQTKVHKTYIARAVFGYETDTQDQFYQRILWKAPTHHISFSLLQEHLTKFRGQLYQRTPLYSSRKVRGRRAYRIARAGQFGFSTLPEEAIKPRQIHVWELELDWFRPFEDQEQEQKETQIKREEGSEKWIGKEAPSLEGPQCQFRIKCSSGCYVRQLISDLGKQVESAAHASSIMRIEQGPFTLLDSLRVDNQSKILMDTEGLNRHIQKNNRTLEFFKQNSSYF